MNEAVPTTLLRLSSRSRKRALVGLTPLIDVVFILLVFLMLASSFLDWRAIDLDVPVKTGAVASSQDTVLVEIWPEGLSLGTEPMSLESLALRVGERLATTPMPVFIKPTEGVPLQRMVEVLDRLTAAGVSDLTLIREPRTD